jgi:hypothetical protein
MSLSKPFFNDRPAHYKRSYQAYDDDAEFKALHWTKQLELRPLGSRTRYQYNRDGDYDNRLDNWDSEDIGNDAK